MNFNIGDKVKLKKNSIYYDQAPNLYGIIVDNCLGFGNWVIIKWINPRSTKEDNYPKEDLIKAPQYLKLLEKYK